MKKTPCEICGTLGQKMLRDSKRRYRHKCPHGVWCVRGDCLGGWRANLAAIAGPNYCPQCVKLGRHDNRA